MKDGMRNGLDGPLRERIAPEEVVSACAGDWLRGEDAAVDRSALAWRNDSTERGVMREDHFMPM